MNAATWSRIPQQPERLVEHQSELVCSMNHDLLGEMATIGHDVLAARLGAATRHWFIAVETRIRVVSGVDAAAGRGLRL